MTDIERIRQLLSKTSPQFFWQPTPQDGSRHRRIGFTYFSWSSPNEDYLVSCCIRRDGSLVVGSGILASPGDTHHNLTSVEVLEEWLKKVTK